MSGGKETEKKKNSVTRKKSPNVYKSCPKMILLEKFKVLTPLQKMPKNVGGLGKLIVAKGLKSCPKYNISPNLVTLEVSSSNYTVLYFLYQNTTVHLLLIFFIITRGRFNNIFLLNKTHIFMNGFSMSIQISFESK